jgi:pyridoxal phosphate enzyme (YggS family)
MPTSLAERLTSVNERIADACARSGRPKDVQLLAVTKTRTADEVRELYGLGLRAFGENRVAEAVGKQELIPPDAEWHMIGHLQSNKAKDCQKFSWVHSIDKVGTAMALDAVRHGSVLHVLLEANTGGEEAKDGARDLDGLRRLTEAIAPLKNLRIRGLMTMAPFSPEESIVRPCFAKLRTWRDVLAREFPDQDWSTLSMGMTNDFEWAIAEGSTLVRIGTALFEGFR